MLYTHTVSYIIQLYFSLFHVDVWTQCSVREKKTVFQGLGTNFTKTNI